MAARTRKIRHDDFTREKIRVSQLLNRLQNHALAPIGKDGKLAPKQDILPSQLKAIDMLLKKILPDQAQVQHTGADGQPLQIIIAPKDAKLA